MASLVRFVPLHGQDHELYSLGCASGVMIFPVVTKTAQYTATDNDWIILADATGGAFSVFLPTAVNRTGQFFEVKRTNSGGNAVTVDANGTETIDGALTYALSSQYASVTIASDGTNWMII